jgi:hypothetical protein
LSRTAKHKAQSMSTKQPILTKRCDFEHKAQSTKHKAQSMSTKQRQKNWALFSFCKGCTGPVTSCNLLSDHHLAEVVCTLRMYQGCLPEIAISGNSVYYLKDEQSSSVDVPVQRVAELLERDVRVKGERRKTAATLLVTKVQISKA